MQNVLSFDLIEIWILFSADEMLAHYSVAVLHDRCTDKRRVRVLLVWVLEKHSKEAEFAFLSYCNRGEIWRKEYYQESLVNKTWGHNRSCPNLHNETMSKPRKKSNLLTAFCAFITMRTFLWGFIFFLKQGKWGISLVPGVPRYGLPLLWGVLLSALECLCVCRLLKDLSHLFCLFIIEFWWEGRCYVGKLFSGSVYPHYVESHRPPVASSY